MQWPSKQETILISLAVKTCQQKSFRMWISYMWNDHSNLEGGVRWSQLLRRPREVVSDERLTIRLLGDCFYQVLPVSPPGAPIPPPPQVSAAVLCLASPLFAGHRVGVCVCVRTALAAFLGLLPLRCDASHGFSHTLRTLPPRCFPLGICCPHSPQTFFVSSEERYLNWLSVTCFMVRENALVYNNSSFSWVIFGLGCHVTMGYYFGISSQLKGILATPLAVFTIIWTCRTWQVSSYTVAVLLVSDCKLALFINMHHTFQLLSQLVKAY